MVLAKAGLLVDLVDTSAERVALVNRSRMPFEEEGADELLPELVKSGLLRATTDASAVSAAEAVVLTIGTPVGEFQDPDVGAFERAVDKVLGVMRPGQLLVLRSTVFPGVTERLTRRMAEEGPGGIDLAYCPERILQGQSLAELGRLPQIVGGVTPAAAARAAALFEVFCPKVLFVTPTEAELAKLFCNAYRYINFAVANEFFLLAERHGADFHRIYHAAREDYPRMRGLARPGFAAGPCLVKDTCQLGAFDHGAFRLGQAALEVNECLPSRLVQMLKRSFDLRDMTVGVLGMAMKPDNDDPRDSLSYKLRKVLALECREVLCTDPYVPDPRLVPLEEVVRRADLIIVATPHDCYKGRHFPQPLIDITNAVSSAVPAAAAGPPPGPCDAVRVRPDGPTRNGAAPHGEHRGNGKPASTCPGGPG
jgi:UDP-N-acetyl-D-mannosaminuronic acid dehydrogenase